MPAFIAQIIAVSPLLFGVVGVLITLFTSLHVAFAGLALLPFPPGGKAGLEKIASVLGVVAVDLQKLVAFFQKSAPPVSP